ncbi:ArnT family glycosyltransferase [Catenulispora subtropica]|uniref:Glycosyl transferase family 39 n=1 Tax=Catenulispora subtropica TaxID=450798 RepID=A0ABP5CKG2_9ACTN
MSAISPASEVVYEIGPPTTGTGGTGRLGRLWRGPEDDPRWARPGLLALLAAAAVLYLWDLSASGWANSFYSAAVQAGTKSWKAMLFGSLDAGNAITVDKPPASLWVMEISGRIFGFGSWSMLAPEALMGVATVGVVYAAVKRVLSRTRGTAVGAGAGLLAAAALAVTPVAVLMFKFNNPDALLTLLLTLAVYAVVRAHEHGSTRWLLLAGTLIGFAFLTKTLQAFLILPALTAVYLATGPGRLLRRLWQVLAAGAAIVVSAGWWVAIVQLTPASSRPYVGGSQHNSFLELTFGYNGFGRLTGDETGSVGGGPRGFSEVTGQPGGLVIFGPGGQTGGVPEFGRIAGGPGGGPRGGGFGGGTAWNRLFSGEIGSQISWLLPAALLLFAFGLWAAGRARRTDLERAGLLAWGLSMLSTVAVFSYMKGIFHPYYTIALAPLIAVTAGIGGGMLWARRGEFVPRFGLAAAVGVTTWWGFELLARTGDWHSWLRFAAAVAGTVAVVLLLAEPVISARFRRGAQDQVASARPDWVPAVDGGEADTAAPASADTEATQAPATGSGVFGRTLRWGALALGVGAALLGPTAYAFATTSTGHTGSIPSAGPANAAFGPGGMGGPGGIRFFNGPGGPGGLPGGMNNQGGQNGQVPGGSQNGGLGQFPGMPGSNQGGQSGQGNQGGQSGQSGQGNQGGMNGQFPGGSQNQGGSQVPGGSQNQGGLPNGTTSSSGGPGGMNSLLDASKPSARMQSLLTADASGYRWVAAAIGAQNAAGYQLATGDPVMAIGGFNGSDPSPTLAQFQAYVAQHKIHYYIAGGVGQANGGADMGGEIGTWVKAHFTAQTVDNVTVYDLTATPTS